METVGRFAPSPSGRLHLGNLLCALLVWLSARQKDGRVLLRVEDLDTARCPRRYSEQMERDLQWLGLDWDIGPGRDNGTGPYYQSQRTEIYQAALETLREKGLVYPCFCTRAELHAASAPHREDGRWSMPGPAAVSPRRRSRKKAKPRPGPPADNTGGALGLYRRPHGPIRGKSGGRLRDFLLRRSDGMFAYQLAVVVDDAAMGVTEVVRGADLLDSTPRQLYLYYLLGLTPPVFYHFPLLLTAEGRRLSKRDGAVGLDSLQDRLPPEEILGRLAFLAGFNPSAAPKTAAELLADFAWEKVPRQDIRIPAGLFC